MASQGNISETNGIPIENIVCCGGMLSDRKGYIAPAEHNVVAPLVAFINLHSHPPILWRRRWRCLSSLTVLKPIASVSDQCAS